MAFTRFPQYDPERLSNLEALSAPMLAAFTQAGYQRSEPPILQPADVFLDLYGEAMRKRVYVFAAPGGEELCLRPDLTVPLALMCLEREAPGARPVKLSYLGPAFRSVAEGEGKTAQFLQTGIERLGGRDDEAQCDAEVFALIHDAVQGADGPTLHFGDLGLFAAFVDALDLPEAWRGRLKRRFRSPAAIHELLVQTTRQADSTRSMGALLTALSHLNEEEARAALQDVLGIAGIDSIGGRSLEEITERFLEQAATLRAAGLPEELTGLIKRFLSTTTNATRAAETVAVLAREAGIDLDAALQSLQIRFDAIKGRNIDIDAAEFAPAFGRDMDYYSGFVFEFRAPQLGDNQKIAGGGRYDTLLTRLGAKTAVPAVGGSVWIERLAAMRKAGPVGKTVRKRRNSP